MLTWTLQRGGFLDYRRRTRRASEIAIATACLRLRTRAPLLERSVPRLYSPMTLRTLACPRVVRFNINASSHLLQPGHHAVGQRLAEILVRPSALGKVLRRETEEQAAAGAAHVHAVTRRARSH